MKLHLTVPLGAGETPESFTSRLACANDLSAREFCRDWGIHFQSVIDASSDAVGIIADLGGVPFVDLIRHGFVREGKLNFRHRNERLVRFSVRRSRIRVCPRCLSEDIRNNPRVAPRLAVHNRAMWLIDAIKTCSAHSLKLVEVGNDLAPGYLHDFAHYMALALPRLDNVVEKAPRRLPTALEIYIQKRLDGARQAPFLDSLELHAAIRTCEMIGAMDLFGQSANLKTLNDDDWWDAGVCGFEFATSAAPISTFLNKLQATHPHSRRGPQGPQVRLGRFYKWLAFGAADTAYDPVRAVVGRHIRDNRPLAAGDIVFGSPVVERTLHSIWSLSTESGMHPKRLRKLLRAAGIIGDDQMALPSHLVTFDPRPAEDLVRRLKGALPLPAAGKYLNAARSQASLLANGRFIKPCVPGARFSANDRYAIEDLDDFLRQLRHGAHMVRKPKPGQATIPAAAKRACRSAAEIVRLILDRKLSWVGKTAGRQGYLSVLVDLDEIRAKVRGADHGGLTQRDVARVIGTHPKVAGRIIAAGDLKSFVAINPTNRCPQVLVKPEEAAKFSRKYVSLFGSAQEKGMNAKTLKRALDAAGVEPAFKPKKIGATFYLRSKVRA